ncbi:MAG: DUF4954 family protein [Bacteroidetes bacterium]|nr:DUF4954 family protein [Bacteroidota bacterium]
MNIINKQPVSALGYGFIGKEFIPKGKDEYYLRNKQHRTNANYRPLTNIEINLLKANDNSAGDWSQILVSDAFDASLVKRCSFFGLVRIGKLEPFYHEFNDLSMPVGLYDSTIISCDFGDNVVVDNVNFMSHYIVGNEVMLVNINELVASNHAKFGNGVLKDGESEAVRIWLEVCNENGGRSILPFNGMLAADAWLWSKFRDDEKLLQQFKDFTDKKFDTHRGYYGKVGDRTVIKNCKIIKDTWIGSDAYLKGANKIKNVTISSSPDAKTQIGEGCELVNGIIGFGCRIFYGVKAVRFFLGSNSQLKYGARLINSFLSENSTISCCEVLNSLIFPAHEQHHNNSFLCAATVMGQSNMAAGATIGSNHNSRGADGEIVAGRGFWPGLCVSLKHNSKFASFTIIAKGDFSYELNIPLPFSLIANDVSNNRLTVMPAYWFQYNMYAMARNSGKYASRDNRADKSIQLEYDYLAPDSVNEIFEGLNILEEATAQSWAKHFKKKVAAKDLLKKGKQLLEENLDLTKLEITAAHFENSERKTILLKVPEAYKQYKNQIIFYGISSLLHQIEENKIQTWAQLKKMLPKKSARTKWVNLGGQLMPETSLKHLIKNIHSKKINSWDAVHDFYLKENQAYQQHKHEHAFAALLEIANLTPAKFTNKAFLDLLKQSMAIKIEMNAAIFSSRAKDYKNPFRKMVYESEKEMEKVIGKLKDNGFILQQQKETEAYLKNAKKILKAMEAKN